MYGVSTTTTCAAFGAMHDLLEPRLSAPQVAVVLAKPRVESLCQPRRFLASYEPHGGKGQLWSAGGDRRDAHGRAHTHHVAAEKLAPPRTAIH
jgi:hypothetical protein